ncbi:MAG: efflux RND transporter periplasmic adaptor subunit [Nevskia sp.]|nr:efflux RND transporter periplasmic adaptor subunit [Nevskia sp.]
MSALLRSPAAALAGLLLLGGCGKPPPQPPEIRPVRTVVAAATPVRADNTYAGSVVPRYESQLGFRVGGKLLGRDVNVGDAVHAGQVLARLDPRDLALAADSSRANVAARRAQLEVARANYERDRKMLEFGGVSRLALDNSQAAYRAAQAQLDAEEAQYRVASNQAAYAGLVADHDGTITQITAEAGQVVAPGQAVARLAWAGENEVETSVPEDQVQRVAVGMPVEVSLWAAPALRLAGTVRELARSADAATRTYALRVQVAPQPPEMRLGMTASVRIADAAAGAPRLVHLPLPAWTEHDGRQGVWIYDAARQAVDFRPLQAAGVDGDRVLVAAGIADGEIVVTAGAPLLLPGQKVRLMDSPSGAVD